MTRPFDLTRFRELRASALRRADVKLAFGEPMHVSALTTSTNDDALRAARDGAAAGATFLAESQSSGRGRRGRAWHAEPGESLLVSVLARPSLELEALPQLSLLTGIAVRRTVSQQFARSGRAARVGVKWPNDVWVDQRKLAGVLVESQIQGGALGGVVIGIGINVHTAAFPDELASSATSLALSGLDCEREELLLDLLLNLSAVLDAHDHGGLPVFASELREHDALFGRRVRVEERVGVARGIDASGRLLLEDAAGVTHAVSAGSVTLEA